MILIHFALKPRFFIFAGNKRVAQRLIGTIISKYAQNKSEPYLRSVPLALFKCKQSVVDGTNQKAFNNPKMINKTVNFGATKHPLF